MESNDQNNKELQEIRRQIANLRAREAELNGDPMMAIGRRIAGIREAAGLSREAFGERLDMKKNQVATLESKANGLTLSRLIRICTNFSVSADEVLGIKKDGQSIA